MLRVLAPGFLTTAQDEGRPGHARLGIGRAGAADAAALDLANALVGNAAGACALEITLLGPVREAVDTCRVALVGAPMPAARIDAVPMPMGASRRLKPGQRLHTGAVAGGCRSYLAVAGGFDFAPWMGSRARDVNGGLGPAVIARGDLLPTGGAGDVSAADPSWSLDCRAWRHGAGTVRLRMLPSCHTRLLTAASMQELAVESFLLQNDSNRVACRLQGPPLRLRESVEVITSGTVAGSIQLPPGGQPIVLGCEHPVTGGYPRIGQLIEVDQPVLAQCRPGDRVAFRWVTMDEALAARQRHRERLAKLRARITERLEETA